MENETYYELFELSHKRKDNAVTPVILDYYKLQEKGFRDQDIPIVLEEQYRTQGIITPS